MSADSSDQGAETPDSAKNDPAKGTADSTQTSEDGQEKPPDPFDSVTRSPYGGDARATGAAYRTGRLNFRIAGSGAAVTDSHIGNLVVGNVTNLLATRAVRFTPGPVRVKDLERIRGWYIEVPEYQDILILLRDRHLVLLRGSAGTGRTTTTLHLLDALTGGRVSRLDPEAKVHTLAADDLEEGCGYLVELSASRAAALTQMHLDRLSALLAKKTCWCVLIVGRDFSPAAAVGGYVADCSHPDVQQLLRRHLSWAIRDADAEVRDALLALSTTPQVREALGPVPTPTEVVGLVDLLVADRPRTPTAATVATQCAAFIDLRVTEWFDNVRDLPRDESADRAIRCIGYRIALAVLNRTSQHFIAEAGERLATRLIRARSPRREPGRPVFSSEHHYWLEASRGHVIQGFAPVGDATVPVQLAAFDDDRMPVAVLAHVWRRHHNARGPLVSWLDDLAGDIHPDVWVRAAQAAGLLCGLDFSDVFRRLVDGWASDSEEHRRIVAAFALDQAAQDPAVLPAVREVIDAWKSDGDEPHRWTAAATLGCDFGFAAVEKALDDLLILGTWREDDDCPIAGIASHSLAGLLAHGAVEPVVRRLLRWLDDRRQVVRDLALLVIVRLINAKVSDLWDVEMFATESGRDRWPLLAHRGRWPLLLALQDEQPKFTEPFADLVWRALNTARSRSAGLDAVTQWIQCRERDPCYLRALASFLMLLADTTGAKRLRNLVATLRTDLQRPLAPDIADYLDHALTKSQNGVSTP
jgi:hypothetical protein